MRAVGCDCRIRRMATGTTLDRRRGQSVVRVTRNFGVPILADDVALPVGEHPATPGPPDSGQNASLLKKKILLSAQVEVPVKHTASNVLVLRFAGCDPLQFSIHCRVPLVEQREEPLEELYFLDFLLLDEVHDPESASAECNHISSHVVWTAHKRDDGDRRRNDQNDKPPVVGLEEDSDRMIHLSAPPSNFPKPKTPSNSYAGTLRLSLLLKASNPMSNW